MEFKRVPLSTRRNDVSFQIAWVQKRLPRYRKSSDKYSKIRSHYLSAGRGRGTSKRKARMQQSERHGGSQRPLFTCEWVTVLGTTKQSARMRHELAFSDLEIRSPITERAVLIQTLCQSYKRPMLISLLSCQL